MAVLKPAYELNMGKGATWTLACTFSPSARHVAVAGLNQKISVGDWRYQTGRNYALHQVSSMSLFMTVVIRSCFLHICMLLDLSL